jgi:hypothetical protein
MNSEFEMRFAAALIALRAECILFSFTSNRFYSTHTDLRFFSYIPPRSLCIGITYLGMVRKAFKI